MALLPKVKLKAVVSFPATVLDGAGIDVVKANGTYTFNIAYDDFAPPVSGLSDPTHQNVLVWNDITNSYVLVPALAFGNIAPATTVPLVEGGSGAIGASVKYAREDHVHPAYGGSGGAIGANVAINGDFRINQGGYVSAAALAAGVYGHDQWKAGASGGDYSFTQLVSSTQITIAAGKSLIQPIEDANVVGGSYVLSWTGTAQARAGVNTLTPSGSYAVSPLLISGQTAGTVMSVEFNAGTLGTVKLESGSTATPFIMRPIDQELVTCKRYWRVMDTVFVAGQAGSTTGGYGIFNYAGMRAVPVITPSGNFVTTNAAMTGVAVTGLPSAFSLSGTEQIVLFWTVASGLVAGNATILLNSSGAKITLSARL